MTGRAAYVDRIIAAGDRKRQEHETDIISVALLKHAYTPDLSYFAGAIAGSVMEACR